MKHVPSIGLMVASLCLLGQAAADEQQVLAKPPQGATPPPGPLVAPPILVKVVEMPDAKPAPPPEPEPAKASLDDLKGGKLIEYGFTIGGSYAFHVPAQWTDFTQKDVTSSFMPYVVVYPGMIAGGEETRAYCAASWAFTPRDGAQKIADRHAVERTRMRLKKEQKEKLKDANAPGPPDGAGPGGSDKQPAADPDPTDSEVEKETGWMPGRAAVCARRLIGIYLGKPLDIKPTIGPNVGLKDATPGATSVFSAGFAWSPNIAFSLLAGVSLWRFTAETSNMDAAMTSTKENRSFWTYTFGIGSNLDIVGALFK